MRGALLLVLVLSCGCGSIFNGRHSGQIMSGLFKAFVVAPAIVGAAVASAAVQQAAATPPPEIEPASAPVAQGPRPCNYWLRCNSRECYYETSDGLIVTCEDWDCRDHAPPQLKAWCPK